jgi:hypothetical protein
VTNDIEEWFRWTPEVAREEVDGELVNQDLIDAVAEFQSMDTEAGEAATDFLQNRALDNHPSTMTRLLKRGGRIHAFYAICSGSFELSQSQRDEPEIGAALGVAQGFRLHPTQPTSTVAWLAKHREADQDVNSALIMAHAIYTAQVVARQQGNVALAVDPYRGDEFLEDHWTGLGFRRAHGKRTRLWFPLHRERD